MYVLKYIFVILLGQNAKTPSLIGISVLILRPIYLDRYNMKDQNEEKQEDDKILLQKEIES
jgi:hypothetical protein